MRNPMIRKITVMGVMAALGIVLVIFIHFPIFGAAPFLQYDPADIPILICTVLFGPWWGLLQTVIISVIQGMLVSADGIVGILMHIFATGAFAVVTGFICKKNKSTSRIAVGLALGAVTMVVFMAIWNSLITPIYMGVPREAVLEMLLPVFIPFNAIKTGVNAVVAFILYRVVALVAPTK